MLKIQIGKVSLKEVQDQKIIPNRTRKYLLPCLRNYGETFTNKFNSVFKVAAGLGDIVISNRGIRKYERHLFILIDSSIATKHFNIFIDWVREQDVYEDDYVFGDIQKSNLHMVIVKFPEQFYNSFETFKKGKYSEMFNKETIDKFFVSDDNSNAPKVLIKDKNYNIVFTNRLNRIFNAQIKPGDYDGELDLPPIDEDEIFNYHLKS